MYRLLYTNGGKNVCFEMAVCLMKRTNLPVNLNDYLIDVSKFRQCKFSELNSLPV